MQLKTTSSAEQIGNALNELMSRMTLAEKVGQMTQIEKNSITPEAVAKYGIGSILSGGGGNPTPNTPQAWADMVRGFQEAALQSRLGIPLIYGSDAVHGHNNMWGATIFPHNVGMGATRDPEVVKRAAQVTAKEMLAVNVHWTFAPEVSVPQDIRWGRTYEGYSEDTALVTEMGVAAVNGYQNNPDLRPVLASVKHYLGDGGTSWGSASRYPWIPDWWVSRDGIKWMIDQGNTEVDEATLRAIHLPPYVAAIAAGARNIMVSYSSWQGLKMHAHRYLLTDVLKGELGFEGFLISDWLATSQLDADFYTSVCMTINAGLDMIMVPFDYVAFIEAVTQAVEQGDIPLERVDDAARRILRVKMELGLFDAPFGDESLLAEVGSEAHRAVAREAVRKSLVLLKNERNTLPCNRAAARIFVAGDAADDIGRQCGGWTIDWQGKLGDSTTGTTLLEGLSEDSVVLYKSEGVFDGQGRAEVGIVVLGEMPGSEGEGDRDDLSLTPEDVELVKRVRAQVDKLVVVLYSGRPLIINEVLELSDAFVAAWLPGTEGAGVSDVLFGDFPFTGKLPHNWIRNMAQVPRAKLGDDPLFPFGYGLTTFSR